MRRAAIIALERIWKIYNKDRRRRRETEHLSPFQTKPEVNRVEAGLHEDSGLGESMVTEDSGAQIEQFINDVKVLESKWQVDNDEVNFPLVSIDSNDKTEGLSIKTEESSKKRMTRRDFRNLVNVKLEGVTGKDKILEQVVRGGGALVTHCAFTKVIEKPLCIERPIKQEDDQRIIKLRTKEVKKSSSKLTNILIACNAFLAMSIATIVRKYTSK